MENTWVVFGATGQQGGAVARALLKNGSTSVRAAVRDPTSPACTILRSLGCELVHADLNDKRTLDTALKGASGIFLVTANEIDENYYARELAQGKNAADAAVEAGVQKIIFSTLPSVKKVTSGRLTKVVHFDVKYDIEQYIRLLPIASSFIALGAFMSNFATFLQPQDAGDGTFTIQSSMPPSTLLPLVDVTDIGHVAAQISKDSKKHYGQTINLAAELKTLEAIAAVIGKVNGKTVEYLQVPSELFLGSLSKHKAEDWAEFGLYMSEFGYFGQKTQTSVTTEFGQLTMFEEFVRQSIVL